MESAEHAKTRVLIFIDRLVCLPWVKLEDGTMNANILLAWTCCRWHHARIISSYSSMRTISEEYQAH
jgi:hypothetical protein